MKIFVTGGTGFVGKVLVRRLVAEGHEVHALSRSASGDGVLGTLGAQPVRGDLAHVAGFAPALAGMEVVVHCASPLPSWEPWTHFEQDIVEATRALAQASREARVRRFIYLSSESVLQEREALLGVGFDAPAAQHPNSFYGRAKKEAEAVLRAMQGLDVIFLRPTFIWGEGCPSFAEVEAKVKAGTFAWVDGGEVPFEAVHVDNVVEAIVRALTRGQPGAAYLVTDGEPATFRAFWERVFAIQGVPSPRRSVPACVAHPTAAALESLWRAAGARRPPPLTRFELAFAAMPRRYDVSRTWADLGGQPVTSREAGFTRLARPQAS